MNINSLFLLSIVLVIACQKGDFTATNKSVKKLDKAVEVVKADDNSISTTPNNSGSDANSVSEKNFPKDEIVIADVPKDSEKLVAVKATETPKTSAVEEKIVEIGEISFVEKPAEKNFNINTVFKMQSSKSNIDKYICVLDNGTKIESNNTSCLIDSVIGSNNIVVYAKYLDGSVSNELKYSWTLEKGLVSFAQKPAEKSPEIHSVFKIQSSNTNVDKYICLFDNDVKIESNNGTCEIDAIKGINNIKAYAKYTDGTSSDEIKYSWTVEIGEIKFAQKPLAKTFDIHSVLTMESSKSNIDKYICILNNGNKIESSDNSCKIDPIVGNNNIVVYAKYTDGSLSNELNYSWTVEVGSISFIKKPDISTSSSLAVFEMTSDKTPDYYECSLDSAIPVKSTNNKCEFNTSYGNHKISVIAKYADGTSSDDLPYSWNAINKVCTISPSSASIEAGQSVTLSLALAAGATNAVINGSSVQGTSGKLVISPSSTAIYNASYVVDGITSSCNTSVAVTAKPVVQVYAPPPPQNCVYPRGKASVSGASCVLNAYTIIVEADGTGNGIIEYSRNLGSTIYNSVITFKAVPDKNSVFVKWTGNVHSVDCYSNSPTINVRLNAIKTCIATFNKK